jgi:ABC-type Fe3+-hydroxamate transport system substrate-binding protein
MKRFAFSFFILCLVFGLFSCSSPAKESASPQAATHTITDAVGREAEIPAQAELFVPLGNTPGMITYPGLADKLLGLVNPKSPTLKILPCAIVTIFCF